jgi:hypothetical protein
MPGILDNPTQELPRGLYKTQTTILGGLSSAYLLEEAKNKWDFCSIDSFDFYIEYQ